MGKVVICDECVPRGFAAMLGDRFEVVTVARLGWAGCSDLELLARLQRVRGAVLVTMDRGMRWTNRHRIGTVGVVLMHARTNQLVDIVELLPDVAEAIARAQPGRVVVVQRSRGKS